MFCRLLAFTAALLSLFVHAEDTYDDVVQGSQGYNYVSAGLQVSNIEYKTPNEVVSTEKQFGGGYARLSFTMDNLLFDLRSDIYITEVLTITQYSFSMGYFLPLNDVFSVYGLGGSSTEEFKYHHVRIFGGEDVEYNDSENALSAEAGFRYKITEKWTIEPAIRTALYEDNLLELRVGNAYQISESVSIEANFQQREQDKLKEMDFQFGVRLRF